MDTSGIMENRPLFWMAYLYIAAQRDAVTSQDVLVALSNMFEPDNWQLMAKLLDDVITHDNQNLVFTTGKVIVKGMTDVVEEAEKILHDNENP